MKLLILHGEGITSSRQKLTILKKGFDPNNVKVFESGANVSDVLGELMTVPLLDEEKLIIWENPPEDFTNYKLQTTNYKLILWFDHEVSSKDLPTGRQILPASNQVISNWDIMFFPEEKEASIFPLLDALGNRDNKAFLELEKRNRTSPNDTQYILTMVFYLLRNLVVTSKNAHDFVRRKNEKMRANFSEKELIYLYKGVLDLDFKIKNGFLEIPQAEFSLVNLFTH